MKKIRVQWLAAALVIIIMGGVLLAILVTTERDNRREMNIELPSGSDVVGAEDVRGRPVEVSPPARRAAVSIDNVQNVIASLDRPAQYYFEAETAIYYNIQSRVTSVRHWRLGDSSKTRLLDLQSGEVKYTMIEDGIVHIWYEGSDEYYQGERGALDADIAAGIPTYEDVLEVDKRSVTAAYYAMLDLGPCIYIETYDELLGYYDRHYISVETGMLVRFETVKDDRVIYLMEMTAFSEDVSGSDAVQAPG